MGVHKTPFLAVDGIILKGDKILLIKRNCFPFKGYWVLPGGHVKYGETLENAIKREIKEELGISAKIEKLIGVYSAPDRDPRYHIVSVAYFLSKKEGKISLNQEATDFRYFPLESLPERIGFDHRRIIEDFKLGFGRQGLSSLRWFLRSKIHKAVITDEMPDYQGSIGIDKALMDKAGIMTGEKVLVVNNTNGSRAETYVIGEKRNSKRIVMYGAICHLMKTGNEITIMGFELANNPPRVKKIILDKDNSVKVLKNV